MQIRRVVLTVIVALAPVTTALAGDRITTLTSDASPPAAAVQPAQPAARAKSPARPEHNSREKTLALLLLMLREGRGAR